tara:strand:+ start:532 stop:822 length:291 start_codon:yes stop_codon:yes gene_type:complete
MRTLALAIAIIATSVTSAFAYDDEHLEFEADLIHWANSQTADEMEEVKSIGPVIAARIIAARPHASIETVDDVKGVGPKTLHKIIAWIKARPRVEH